MKIAEKRFEYLRNKSVEELMKIIEDHQKDLVKSEKMIEETKNYHDALELRRDILFDKDIIRACQRLLNAKTSGHVK